MRIPFLSNLLRRPQTALVPVKPPEPEPSPQEKIEQVSRQQLLDVYSQATQNPPPGPGGIFGISEPYDIPPPVETPQEYAARHRKGPKKNIGGAKESLAQVGQAHRRGDHSFERLRVEDTRDKVQTTHDRGDSYTWLVLLGACAIFLLFTVLLIVLPHGQQASTPTIWVY